MDVARVTGDKKAGQRIDNGKKHSLGQRAFLIFLFPRLKWVIFFAALTFAAWYGERWIPVDYLEWEIYATQILLALTIAFFVFIFFETYMEYRYYTYLFSEEAFIMTYGYMTRNEVATLYHHIQNVNIERSVLDRAIGVSKLIILMTGSDRTSQRNQIVLPAIGRKKARIVQAELLRRARRDAMQHPEED
jgi:uncharacterized membrane protein YdbT with pleckstrin-like domain